eukprot:1143411-Pelagomonas_calceolata.AAC.3
MLGNQALGWLCFAAVQCADFLHVYLDSQRLQCIWVRCDTQLFGIQEDVILGAVYINLLSQRFPVRAVTDSFSSLLSDEVVRVTQVSPHVLLCGDLNAKIGRMREVTDVHGGLFKRLDGAPCPIPRP